jgi:hypothetical protein
MLRACLWNSQWYDGGDQTMTPIVDSCTASPITDEVCPACEGPVVNVLCGV